MSEATAAHAPPSHVDPDSGGLRTPLFGLHTELGGRMVNFGGHALPMRYGEGTVAEHRWTRTSAGMFDVSHMGIIDLHPAGVEPAEDEPPEAGPAGVAAWLEQCVPGSIVNLAPGRMRYTLFTTAAGGVLDDLIVSNLGTHLRIVVNAVRTDADLAALQAINGDGQVRITLRHDLALLALQGPEAARVMARWAPAAKEMAFMSTATLLLDDVVCEVSRCGYTGEDGFEIAMPSGQAEQVAQLLLSSDKTAPAGLGARDTLRLEAGLPLVGHELTETTTPAEAGLGWSIPKRRRVEGGFPGAELITAQLREGPPRKRVGIAAHGRRPIRDGTKLKDADGNEVGIVTSGGYGPTVDAPIAMAYVAAPHAADGTELAAQGRRGDEPCHVAPLPFVEHRYWRPA